MTYSAVPEAETPSAGGAGAFPLAKTRIVELLEQGRASQEEVRPLVTHQRPSLEVPAPQATGLRVLNRGGALLFMTAAVLSVGLVLVLGPTSRTATTTEDMTAAAAGAVKPLDYPRLGAGPDGKLGTCYDPAHNPGYPGDMAGVFQQDFGQIAQHFRLVRTFYSNYYGTEVMPFIAAAGLQAALGVSIGLPERAEAEKQAAIRAFHDHGDNLNSIYVGNEDLHPVGPFSVDDIIKHMTDLRSAGVNKPIGTTQRINEWLSPSPEIDKLAAACDVIGVNIYPFFSTAHNDGEAWELANQPVENMRKQFEAVQRRFPGQEWKVRITETGWPTQGSRNFAQHDSNVDIAQKYFYGFLGWACSQPMESFYYTYYDSRWASNPDYEGHFGVANADGTPKYDLPSGVCQ